MGVTELLIPTFDLGESSNKTFLIRNHWNYGRLWKQEFPSFPWDLGTVSSHGRRQFSDYTWPPSCVPTPQDGVSACMLEWVCQCLCVCVYVSCRFLAGGRATVLPDTYCSGQISSNYLPNKLADVLYVIVRLPWEPRYLSLSLLLFLFVFTRHSPSPWFLLPVIVIHLLSSIVMT